jgi:hypothetical protein
MLTPLLVAAVIAAPNPHRHNPPSVAGQTVMPKGTGVAFTPAGPAGPSPGSLTVTEVPAVG